MRFGKSKLGQEGWISFNTECHVIVVDDFLYHIYHGKIDKMYITGFDIEDEIEAFNKSELTELMITSHFSQGQIKDLNFLSKVQHVKRLTIDFWYSDINLTGLYSLTELENLILYVDKKSAKKVSFSQFKNLKELTVNFFPSNSDDAILPSVEHLFLISARIKSRTFKELSHLNSLKSLYVRESNFETLEGLPSSVEKLDFWGCRSLKSLSGIEGAKDSLQEVTIEKSRKLTDYSGLSQCQELNKLHIIDCGPISSISFLNEMPKLKDGSFLFYGADILDKDVSPGLGCNQIGFDSKKEYNYTLEQISAINLGQDPQEVLNPYQGSPVIEIPVFGEVYEKQIEDDALEETVKLGRNKLDLRIDFSDGVPAAWLDRYSAFAAIMPQLIDKIKASFTADYHSEGGTYDYLNNHYEDKSNESQLKKFKLKRIVIYPNSDQDYAVWDYVIPAVETDYVLAVTTDVNGDIISILMES